jgi:hypothetical protein
MKRLPLSALPAMLAVCALMTAAAPARCADPARQLDKANVLPLAMDDQFQFRKTELFLNDPKVMKPTSDQMISFERDRVNFKAVTSVDQKEREGQYFTFFWRAGRKADVVVRLEYRQENLGSYVQARELAYNEARGSMKSKFAVIGDDFLNEGHVTAWRALIIENGKIVGLTQSYLWN